MFVIDPYKLGEQFGVAGLGNAAYASVYASSNGYVTIDQLGEGGSYRIATTSITPAGWLTPAFIGNNFFASYSDVYMEFLMGAFPSGYSLVIGICNDSIITANHVGVNSGGIGWYGGPILSTGVYYNNFVTGTVNVNSGSVTIGSRVSVRLQYTGGNYMVSGYINGVLIDYRSAPVLSGNNYMAVSLNGPNSMIQCTRASQVRHPIAGSTYLG